MTSTTTTTMTTTTSRPEAGEARSVAARALIVPIRLYQVAAGGRPSPCRYWPSCSTYAIEALAAHGAVRGGWLAGRRLLRCHPWARRSGVDPVPAPKAV